jgi:inorganic pyrophosphatase
MAPLHPITALPAFDAESGDLNAVVETTKGSRNKCTFDPALGLFRLAGVLPAGASFPFDFGFVPSTLGEDGDPLDVLVLMDEPAFAGCLVSSRLLGVITARQTERDGSVEQNDRLVAVAAKSRTHEQVRGLDDLGEALLGEIEHFFVSYNEVHGKTFEPTGRQGAHAAAALVHDGETRARAGKRRARR